MIPLRLIAAVEEERAGIYEQILGSGGSYDPRVIGSGTTTVISNEKIKDIIKIIKSLEDSDLLIKDVIQTIENIEWVDFLVCY